MSIKIQLHRKALAALAASVCLLALGAVPQIAHAEDDDMTFEQRMIDKLMKGLGATDGSDSGIDYRERSPLVVPKSLDLPPPEKANAVNAPNWPNDPDVAEKKARRAASAQRRKPAEWEDGRRLTAEEMAQGRDASKGRVTGPSEARREGGRLSAGELGYKGNIFSDFFGKGGKQEEAAAFKGEPTRSTLTEPPTGYQTPSGTYAYGTGKKDDAAPLPDQEGKPIAPGKF